MTYWAREHEQNLRRIGDAIRDMEAVYEDLIPTLIHELKEDDATRTAGSRTHFGDARIGLAKVLTSIELGRRALPEPYRGPRFPQTAAEVMRRDG